MAYFLFSSHTDVMIAQVLVRHTECFILHLISFRFIHLPACYARIIHIYLFSRVCQRVCVYSSVIDVCGFFFTMTTSTVVRVQYKSSITFCSFFLTVL